MMTTNNNERIRDKMRVRKLRISYEELLRSKGFPNFHKSGSVRGMKKFYYGKDALLVRCGDYIYNVDFATYNMAD